MSADETAGAPGKQVTMSDLKPPVTREGNLPAVSVGFASLQSFELLQRVSKMFATSTVVPDQFNGNIGNCAIALEMAARMGASPLMVMQNLDVIYGRPAWRAKFLIGCFNQAGRYEAISYEWGGKVNTDSWSCRAISKFLATGKQIRGPEISIALAKAEEWYGRKGSKWKTIPELMLMYRSAAWMINTTAPEISLGLQTEDEIRDTFDATRRGDGRYEVDLESLRQPRGSVPTNEEAIASIKKCENLTTLEAVYGGIVQAFVGADQNVPMPVEATYTDHKIALEQKAEES
jgi:hypothetical protein